MDGKEVNEILSIVKTVHILLKELVEAFKSVAQECDDDFEEPKTPRFERKPPKWEY